MEELLIQFLIVVAIILLCFVLIMRFFHRPSKVYRRELSDLYVAAKIREIAINENIDLNLERDKFVEWNKKNLLNERDYLNYDTIVEDELKEKVKESLDKTKK